MQEKEILKYLKSSTSPMEKKDMESWVLSSDKNTRKFNLIKAQYIASSFDRTSQKNELDKVLEKYKKTIQKSSRKEYYKLNSVLKYAAMIVVIFGIGYMYAENFFYDNKINVTPVFNETITLQLENGNIQLISDGKTAEVVDSKGNLVGIQSGRQLVYQNKNSIVEKLVYNTLTVPYGKRFDVVLSDGTQVLLNAGTSMKYPVKFMEGENREVFLKGEAFFDVAKDANHPFIVNAGTLNVRVLGTQFNITSYPEDAFTNTILVEGSVSVYGQKDAYNSISSSVLRPGDKASWNKIKEDISIEEVDISLYTSWVKGRITFRHLPFKNIIKKLERHYNVVIINNNKELENKLFTASFDVETIEQVFSSFRKNHGIDFSIKDNQITINP